MSTIQVPIFCAFDAKIDIVDTRRQTSLLNRKVFDIPQSNVCNGIIQTIRKQMPGTTFATPLVEHLEMMGKKVLDSYNDLEIVLKEHNVILRFRTSREDGEAMR